MNTFVSLLIVFTVYHCSNASPLRLQKRAAFYIANETACVVDNIVYSNGDPIPTDDPCESCKCRPPGFACVLKDCQAKPGCRAVRREGHCCPDYICESESVDLLARDPFVKEEEPSIETTFNPNTIVVPGVTYVEDSTQPPEIYTTSIEVIDSDIEKAAVEHPEGVEIYAVVPEESSETSVDSGTGTAEIMPSTLIELDLTPESSVENNPESGVILLNSEVGDEISSESTEVSEDSSSISASDEETVAEMVEETKPEEVLEAVSKSEETPSPSVENIDVEPEEPSNNLESDSSVSDYGKSLRFPDESETLNHTEKEITIVTQDSKSEESKVTEVPVETSSFVKIQDSTESASKEIKEEKEVVTSTGKNLYYVAKENSQAEPVETVTTFVSVEENTKSSVSDRTETFPPTQTEKLFKSLAEKLEVTDEKVTTTEDSITSLKEVKVTDTTVNPFELVEKSLKSEESGEKVPEKIVVPEDLVSSTFSPVDVTETSSTS